MARLKSRNKYKPRSRRRSKSKVYRKSRSRKRYDGSGKKCAYIMSKKDKCRYCDEALLLLRKNGHDPEMYMLKAPKHLEDLMIQTYGKPYEYYPRIWKCVDGKCEFIEGLEGLQRIMQ